jgi:5-methylcytosine-specific restriction endonuclease McrA
MIPSTSAIRKVKRKHNVEYVFLCETCGCEITRRQSYLKVNNTPGRCRGCANTKFWSERLRPYEHTYNRIKKQGQHPVELTYEEFLTFTQKEECTYCSAPILWLPRKRYRANTSGHHLDRKDNDRGYTLDNCVVSCWECNRIKGSFYSYDEMLTIGPLLRPYRLSRPSFIESPSGFSIPRIKRGSKG